MELTIDRFWDGRPCPDGRLHARVRVARGESGVTITASLPHQPAPRVPDAPVGSRVANLWEYDVVECFLVGEAGYLEVELGAGGHFLVLGFSAPRVRRDEHRDLVPHLAFDPGGDRWTSSIVVPHGVVPAGLRALNAFVVVRNAFLAYHPMPGPAPDFHQPATFPAVWL